MTTEPSGIKVYRGGRTARERTLEKTNARLGSKGRYRKSGESSYNERRGLTLEFALASKGGGTTDVHVHIGPEVFPLLLKTMVKADRKAAMIAMSAELAEQIRG